MNPLPLNREQLEEIRNSWIDALGSVHHGDVMKLCYTALAYLAERDAMRSDLASRWSCGHARFPVALESHPECATCYKAERDAAWNEALETAAEIFDKAAGARWADAVMYNTAKHPARASARQCESDAKELESHAAHIRAVKRPEGIIKAGVAPRLVEPNP